MSTAMSARIDISPRINEKDTFDSMRVLVVEDEKKTASFVRKALQAEGLAVDVLHDGQAVSAAVELSPFDVIEIGRASCRERV